MCLSLLYVRSRVTEPRDFIDMQKRVDLIENLVENIFDAVAA